MESACRPSVPSPTSTKARRTVFGVPLLLLFALPLSMGAYDDGCIITIVPAEPEPEPGDCELACEFGFKTDSAGNEYCECLEDEACIEIVAPPHVNPDTGECVDFPTVCDIPNGWEECDTEPEGCVVDGVSYDAGDVVPGSNCGECRCRADGVVICDDANCIDGCEYNGERYAPGDTFPADDGCNTCSCDENGSVACTLMACFEGCEYNGAFYEEGESFPDADGCNTCFCGADGNVSCTDMACVESCEYNGELYPYGATFPADDGCNTCSCGPDGVSCTEIACTDCLLACEFGFKHDSAGNEYCECRETDACIEIAPAPHFDPDSPDGQCIDFPTVCDIPNSFYPCEQAPPRECNGEVFCDAMPPICPEGEVPTTRNGCWGECIPRDQCIDL